MAVSRLLPLTLGTHDRLSDGDNDALAALPVRRQAFAHKETIISRGPTAGESCLLISGMALRAHPIDNHATVYSALHVPGDFVDLHAFLLTSLDHDVVAQGECLVEFVETDHLTTITRERPHLTRLLWLQTLIDAKISRTWAALGATMRAPERVGHLLCELDMRYAAVGFSEDHRFRMPLHQKDLSAILGFSVAHINRAVQELRERGLVAWQRDTVHLPDFEALTRFARFEGTYLEASAHPR